MVPVSAALTKLLEQGIPGNTELLSNEELQKKATAAMAMPTVTGWDQNFITNQMANLKFLADQAEAMKKFDVNGDGVVDTSDNCPRIANADQLDTDRDRKSVV